MNTRYEGDARRGRAVSCLRDLRPHSALVDEYGLADRCVINTFSGVLHECIQEKYGDKHRRHIFCPIRSMGRDMKLNPYATGAYCCCVFSTDVRDSDFVRSYGVRAGGGASIKDEETLDHAIAYGVELITCNNPDHILALLRAKIGINKA